MKSQTVFLLITVDKQRNKTKYSVKKMASELVVGTFLTLDPGSIFPPASSLYTNLG